MNAFRLYQRVKSHHTFYIGYTCITLTPKLKDTTHQQLLSAFHRAITQYKSLIDYVIAREDQHTNHYHGVIISKDKKNKFTMLKRHKNFKMYVSYNKLLEDQIDYMIKHNPTAIYTTLGVEYFNRPFHTDTLLAP